MPQEQAVISTTRRIPSQAYRSHLTCVLQPMLVNQTQAAQIGGYARPPYRKAATLSDQSPKPLDVTDWVWAAGGGDDLDGPHHSMPARSHGPHRGICGCCLYEALERSLEASAG